MFCVSQKIVTHHKSQTFGSYLKVGKGGLAPFKWLDPQTTKTRMEKFDNIKLSNLTMHEILDEQNGQNRHTKLSWS